MASHKLVAGIWMSIVVFSFTATFAQAPTVKVYKFSNVNAPGAAETDTYAVNDYGVIAGDYVDSSNVQHGMILNGKSLTSVDRQNCQTSPGAGSIAFFGINNTKGLGVTVVGWCFDTAQNTEVAFTYSNGQFISIDPTGSTATVAQGINDKGEVVGAYIDSGKVQHGFLFNGKQYTNLDVPNHTSPDAWSINNKGLIAVFALNGKSLYDSFLFNGQTYKNVDFKGAVNSFIHTIDNYGDRIYTVTDSSGTSHGVFFLAGKGGGYRKFDDPTKGVLDTYATGLSDKLEIIGNYTTSSRGPQAQASQGYEAYGCCRGLPPHDGRSR